MSNFKPLLASPVDFKEIDYSNTWASPKLDGIRAIIIDGVVVSRNLKPIPNKFVQFRFGNRPEIEGYDGELIVGSPTDKDCYRNTNSGVMSVEGEPDVRFNVFDHIAQPTSNYFTRQGMLRAHLWCVLVPHFPVESEAQLLDIEAKCLDVGYEGVMLRAHSGPQSFYKYGRATPKSGTLSKLKRFTDAEAKVIGYMEQMHNGNEKTVDALGNAKRSSHAENKTGKGTLGALICVDPETDMVFNIGTGFDEKTKQQIWDTREELNGKIVKYKSFKIGVKDAPRFPVFLGFRDPIDI